MRDDNELIRQAISGSEEAFRELILRHKERALRLAYSLLGDLEEAKDISQEAFIRSWRSLRHFHGKSTFYTWFCRILINLCIDQKRKKKFRQFFVSSFRHREDPEQTHDILEEIISSEKRPDEKAVENELKGRIEKGIGALPRQQKTVFILKNVEGYKISEIASLLGISSGAVKANLWQATEKLRKALKKYD